MKQSVYHYSDRRLVITEHDGVLEMEIERYDGKFDEERSGDSDGDCGEQLREETPPQVRTTDTGLPRYGEPQIYDCANNGGSAQEVRKVFRRNAGDGE